MSFVKTLATLAAGFAVAKGYDKYNKMGGMPGIQDAMRDNPAVANATQQVGAMMDKLGVPGGSAGLQKMMDQFMGTSAAAGGGAAAGAAAGFGGLLTAMGGAAASGTEQAGRMMNALTGKTAVSGALEENAKLMIRAMIEAAKADGEIDPEERARILEHLGDVSPEERAFVEAEMARPADMQGLAAEAGEQTKAQIYAMSLMAIRVDSAAEASYLDGLAAALGLSEDTRRAIHSSMGLS